MATRAKHKERNCRMRKPRAIDLFSGCGGLTVGLEAAGFNVVAAVENDHISANTYKMNHPDVNLKEIDIRRVSPKKLMRELKMRRGQLDLLAGCPPCQGFSTLRTRNGAKRNRDSRNSLVNQMVRFARVFRPKAIMMENVPRLKDHKLFADLCECLRKVGYHLSFDVKDASRYGVPQRRKRLILVGGRGIDVKLASESSRVRTVRGAIGHLSAPARSKDKLHSLPEMKRSAKVTRLIRDIPKDGGSRTDLPKSRQLACHKKSDGFKDIYGRMAWYDVAPTITGGCFNPSKGRFLHPKQNRAITMREAALLQSFPSNYQFVLSAGNQAIALMIGNALPPEFIRRHAVEIRTALKI